MWTLWVGFAKLVTLFSSSTGTSENTYVASSTGPLSAMKSNMYWENIEMFFFLVSLGSSLNHVLLVVRLLALRPLQLSDWCTMLSATCRRRFRLASVRPACLWPLRLLCYIMVEWSAIGNSEMDVDIHTFLCSAQGALPRTEKWLKCLAWFY